VLDVETHGVGNVGKNSVDPTIYLTAEKRQRQRSITLRTVALRQMIIVLEGIIVIVIDDGKKKMG